MTAQAFTDWELDQPEHHEFFRGEVLRVFGMGGARREPVRVTMKIARSLDNHLAGTPCQAFIADMKVQRLRQSPTTPGSGPAPQWV